MLYQITKIEFDFDDEDLTDAERDDIIGDTVGHIWEADDDEDVIQELIEGVK